MPSTTRVRTAANQPRSEPRRILSLESHTASTIIARKQRHHLQVTQVMTPSDSRVIGDAYMASVLSRRRRNSNRILT